MTRDDIIKLAQEACDTDKSEPWDGGFWIFRQESIERFYRAAYAAGAAAEREACAKMFDGEHDAYIALAIRARSKT